MAEINLLEKSHPQNLNRKIEGGWRTEKNKIIAKRYDFDFFDGDRVNGYGGYYYDGRWKHVVKKLQELYRIDSKSSVLDIGCAKGFLLYDLQEMIPGIKIAGIDISDYALRNAMQGYGAYQKKQLGVSDEEANKLEKIAREKILPSIIKGNADNLPWVEGTFDLILSINTTHNLPEDKIVKSINEMKRVSKDPKKMFIQVDAYRNKEEFDRMQNWVLTAETMKSVEGWLEFFKKNDYSGDYFWTII